MDMVEGARLFVGSRVQLVADQRSRCPQETMVLAAAMIDGMIYLQFVFWKRKANEGNNAHADDCYQEQYENGRGYGNQGDGEERLAQDVWGCSHTHLGSRDSTGKGMCDCFVSLSGRRRRQAKAWCGVVLGVDDVGMRGIWREANRG
ncbi:uncharacterized protein MONOS_17152 [Monocercomonoides exilis]|uniref:uncharacterized protein n=1 Tax=Monocercomonoides exilis TaxID=2049356 RepID=UPI003559E5FF|nr:hypothetical protein MONOS_17152 [Monocercomonoides exilis]